MLLFKGEDVFVSVIAILPLILGTRSKYAIPMKHLTNCGDIKIGKETFATFYSAYVLECIPCSQSRKYQTKSRDGTLKGRRGTEKNTVCIICTV